MKNYKVTYQDFWIDYKENNEKDSPKSSIKHAEDIKDLLNKLEISDENYYEDEEERYDDILAKLKSEGGFFITDDGFYWDEPERHEYMRSATYVTIREISDEELKKQEESKTLKAKKKLEENSAKWENFLFSHGKDLETLVTELKKLKFPSKI